MTDNNFCLMESDQLTLSADRLNVGVDVKQEGHHYRALTLHCYKEPKTDHLVIEVWRGLPMKVIEGVDTLLYRRIYEKAPESV